MEVHLAVGASNTFDLKCNAARYNTKASREAILQSLIDDGWLWAFVSLVEISRILPPREYYSAATPRPPRPPSLTHG